MAHSNSREVGLEQDTSVRSRTLRVGFSAEP